MILLHVQYKLKPNVRDEFIAKLREHDLAGQYRRQPGNITYEYLVPIAEEDVLWVIDAWEDEAACEAHLSSPASEILGPLKQEYVLETKVKKFEIS
ncbi:MAG: antibiotic biosynthesis monooxygenase [Peptococcaceae bacterium]|nr:antibiotic biosynthesis monooxygenase [Peptococcaceae bacterium]